jgi:hypothetical protein
MSPAKEISTMKRAYEKPTLVKGPTLQAVTAGGVSPPVVVKEVVKEQPPVKTDP